MIRVDKRLPDVNEDVLFFAPGGFSVGCWTGEHWYDTASSEQRAGVILWQPLPEPEEDDGA